MLIYTKYKSATYLNLDNIFEFDHSIKDNAHKLKSLFKHSKRLIRSLILLHFYIYSLHPFCPVLFRSSARYFLRFDSNILTLVSLDCYKSYFKFN